MQIKHQALAQYIQKKLTPIYILIGQDHYLLEDGLKTIKHHLKQAHTYDEKMLPLQSADDWKEMIQEANSYSLFSDTVLINSVYDKKTLDAAGKKILTEYLKVINSRCFIIIRAPNLPAKQLTWLTNHDEVTLVVAYPLNAEAMRAWISNELKKYSFSFHPEVPAIIQHYTQGNMLACAQTIEKISLSNPSGIELSVDKALEHLSDQCDYTLFELIDACLIGQADKALHIVRQASADKTEATLVLWMLTQEVRVLLQLHHLLQQKIDMKTAASQLKIWPQRVNFYQLAIKRLNNTALRTLLSHCQSIDEQIKSSSNTQAWNALEQLTLNLASRSL